MNMTITPLHDFVTIEMDQPEEVSAGGIVMIAKKPDQTVETGTITNVGPGTHINGVFDAMVLKPGDRVLFNKGTGQVVEVEKQKILFLKQRDIMGVLK